MQTISQEEIIRILPKGVMTIPKRLRQSVGFSENSLARIKEESGKLILEPVFTAPYPIRTYKGKEVDEFFRLDRKETKELKKKKLLKR